MTKKISVIIITRNRAKALSRCLSSLVEQSHLPNKVVIVDNASEDDTKKVILSFKKKLPIKYVYEEKIGIPYARNRGIKAASGTILLMLDDDCEAENTWVERMAATHKKYPKAWVIQGRSYSLPTEKSYSLYAEFARFLHLRHCTKEQNLNIKEFFSKDPKHELEILTCDTKNFSIKTSYLKKYNLSFDEQFYTLSCGEDTDLGHQITEKNGLIMYCSDIIIYHWERSTLRDLLEQRWHIGRATARISEKWKFSYFRVNLPRPGTFFILFIYCKLLKKWYNLPALIVILLMDKLYRSNGWFYEKRMLSFEKQ